MALHFLMGTGGIAVFLVFVVCCVLIIPSVKANSSPVCVCTCCIPRSGVCLSDTEGNFTVSSCQQTCTEEECRSRFSLCRAPGSNIQTSCSNAASPFDTFLITASLLLIGILASLSLLQYKSKVIRAVFPVRFQVNMRGQRSNFSIFRFKWQS